MTNLVLTILLLFASLTSWAGLTNSVVISNGALCVSFPGKAGFFYGLFRTELLSTNAQTWFLVDEAEPQSDGPIRLCEMMPVKRRSGFYRVFGWEL